MTGHGPRNHGQPLGRLRCKAFVKSRLLNERIPGRERTVRALFEGGHVDHVAAAELVLAQVTPGVAVRRVALQVG